MIPLAHSAGHGRRAQTYAEHVQGVKDKTAANLADFTPYISSQRFDQYAAILGPCAEFHDLGKLNAGNQEVLCGHTAAEHLPVEHRDAGVKYLLGDDVERPAATLVYAHHAPGLPDIRRESAYNHSFRFESAIDDSDSHMQEYLEVHRQAVGGPREYAHADLKKLTSFEYRVLLSCLVDADYSDTGGEELKPPPVCWGQRLKKLDEYVDGLSKAGSQSDSERNELRRTLYRSCRDALTENSLEYCDSPVGTGKTTAVLAHMLKTAQEQNLRRIFIVLPFTNIISQTVEVLRKAIVLDGENPQEVVAENHHLADFETIEYRHLSSTWTPPIVVTTAVQFFETLAGNQPARLRKLHQLPGSGIIFDEFHDALPIALMPLAWRWMTELTERWGCHICMCSATSVKFWEDPAFDGASKNESPRAVEQLIPNSVSSRLNAFEESRIVLDARSGAIPHFSDATHFEEYIREYHGSKIVVFNTVKSAAAFAKHMRGCGYDVLHLSSALSPEDRDVVVREIERRLQMGQDVERDWILVATSCVECGLDFSFHYGFCELRSLASYIQLSGRVRRNREPAYEDASISVFTIVDDGFSANLAFQSAKNIFNDMIDDESLSRLSITQAVTKAFRDESKLVVKSPDHLCADERGLMLSTVASEFHVIDDEGAVTAIASQDLAQKLASGIKVTPTELQKGSVRINPKSSSELHLAQEELPVLDSTQYDGFLGYMKSLV